MKFRRLLPLFSALLLTSLPLRAEVMLQWFETDWDEMYRRLPEAAEIGYDWLWIPPPTKGPTGKGTIWANVGYNLYDRFDIGDVPQRGTLDTRYGTRGSLRNMVDNAHQLDIRIIPDIVVNHNGNGPDFREYPGMIPEDFHVQWEEGYVNTLNYKRGPRMDQWSPDGGFGGTMWMELAQLIDIRTEDSFDPNRFTGGNNTPGWNLVAGQSFLRHPGQFDKYPFYPAGYTNENAAALLYRWIAWLGNAIDYDGLRIDAGKHIPWEFFGQFDDSKFLHEAQWNFGQRHGFDNNGYPAEVFQNDILRKDALIFAEILSPWSEIEYWYGYGSNDRNPMRFLDYAMKKSADGAFNGNLSGLGAFGSDFGPDKGILYVWGHDEGGPGKINLAYAYILSHIGLPMVYFTGNNISWDDHGREPWPGARTWMIPGYDGQALGDTANDIPNLVWIHDQFAWGSEWKLWENDGDYFALERYFDADSNGRDEGDAIMLVALNDSGGDQTRNLCTSFAPGTVLKDYTGHAGDVTVGGAGCVNITVPGNGGQGWVCYAPRVADPVNIAFQGAGVTTMNWIIPGGVHASDKARQFTRITGTNFTVHVDFGTPGGAVDNVMLKWGEGEKQLAGNTHYTNDNSLIVANYEEMNGSGTNWDMNIEITDDNIPEGLNSVRIRLFNQRPAGMPALYNTQTKVVYVDRRGPELDITYPTEGETIHGDAVLTIRNPDYTVYGMTVGVNGATNTAHEVMKGLWKYALTGLPPGGPYTITVTATEADWDSPRTVINTSVYTRTISVAAPSTISLNHSDGHVQELPFFTTSVTAPGASDVHLYWDGYELPFNLGNYSNVFNGEVEFRDGSGPHDWRLWGNFVNGQHFFEAARVDGAVTSRAVARVQFNLYGGNHIDTDGDGIPDNVEVPFFDDGAPGPDQPLPGDDNDFVPEPWETWTRLNPYNHSTFYSGQWDDQNDFDGDGFNNYQEVFAGYIEDGNIYKYNIYDAGSSPTGGTPSQASYAAWFPSNGVARGATLTVNYFPAEGALQDATQALMHVGHSAKTEGGWQDVIDTNMTWNSDHWEADYLVPSNATSVDFTFWNGVGIWDGKNWRATVAGNSNFFFVMDGILDSQDYILHPDGMRIAAAVKSNNLYVATWSTEGNDVFMWVSDELGDANAPAQGWNKQGVVFVDTSAKPEMVAEADNKWSAWANVSGVITNGDRNPANENALEGEFNLVDAFGYLPQALYIAAGAYGSADGGTLVSQGPYPWETTDGNVDIMEFLRVPLSSISDQDMDGTFDGGKPQMWTVLNGQTNDANYGLRRFFLDERAGDTASLTVVLKPNVSTNSVLSNVELFSNINRRDFAVLPGDEDPDTVTTSSQSTYYRAYPMTDNGDGTYSYTLTISKCGAYRINARYRVDGGPYRYFTDDGLRRDCAVVVSPKKALQLTMYELNPLYAEAVDDTFFGRSTFKDIYLTNTNKPDVLNTNYFRDLGINMIWLQPIHPIGSDNRQNDPDTGLPYDPGSPYAVRNYWKVNSVLGDPSTEAQALQEFKDFVAAMDDAGVGVMLDGTFNHSAWDCEIGQVGVDMFDWASNPGDLIRDIRPEWYSKRDNYDQHASYYFSANDTDLAPAPDRIDFGKWLDAADFYFGTYDALVQKAASNTNDSWSSQWWNRYLLEEDRFDGFQTNLTRQLWEYFSYYPIYWLEQTGHPEDVPKSQSYKGIDGLRCDFAQGLPSEFWEYTINKTRGVKWDFIFMAESLDGFREVNGSKRHGVGYRSSRHFDVLNENMVFYWRDKFFDYLGYNNSTNPFTGPTVDAFEERKSAFDDSPILLNITSHDEVLPSDEQWRLLYAYAELAAMNGVPLILYGQEAGAQNDAATYGGPIDPGNNFARYEVNFGKAIPNFKRYNHMTNIWDNLGGWAQELHGAYQRIGAARRASTALRSRERFFLGTNTVFDRDPDIFAVAKFDQAGVSASTQEVVFVFVNNNFQSGTNRWATYFLDVDYQGNNWFGIEAGKTYNVVDLISKNPTNYLWTPSKTGAELLSDGITVGLTGTPFEGQQAQYLRLFDTAIGPDYPDLDGDGIPDFTDPDEDGDGLPDWWEIDNDLDPRDPNGIFGGDGDKDGDHVSNKDEFDARTDPDAIDEFLKARIQRSGSGIQVLWDSVPDMNYRVKSRTAPAGPEAWQSEFFGTALGSVESIIDTGAGTATQKTFRIEVKP